MRWIAVLPLLLALVLILRNMRRGRRSVPAFVRDEIVPVCDACEQSSAGHLVRTLAEAPFWKQDELNSLLMAREWQRMPVGETRGAASDTVSVFLVRCPLKETCVLLVWYSPAAFDASARVIRREVLGQDEARQAWEAASPSSQIELPTQS